jgi:hypothetical protein
MTLTFVNARLICPLWFMLIIGAPSKHVSMQDWDTAFHVLGTSYGAKETQPWSLHLAHPEGRKETIVNFHIFVSGWKITNGQCNLFMPLKGKCALGPFL